MTDSLRLPAPDMVTATPPGCQNGHPEALPLPAKTDVINLKQVPKLVEFFFAGWKGKVIWFQGEVKERHLFRLAVGASNDLSQR